MKKLISIVLTIAVLTCLSVSSVFAEDKVVRLSPENAIASCQVV